MNLLAILFILAVLQSASVQSESFIGVLSGPEKSGEQHQYMIDIEPGTLLVANASFSSLEGVGARIYAAIGGPLGGNYAYRDELLSSSSSRTLNLSYYFGSSTNSGRVRVLVGSIADRYAPAVVGYVLSVHRYRLLDMGLGEAGDGLESPLQLSLRDMESNGSTQIISINGYLSPRGIGNDYADYYLIRLPAKDDYVVSAEIVGGSSQLINAYIRLRDGYPVSRAIDGGYTASLKSVDEFLVSIETAGVSSSIIRYNLTLRVSRLSDEVENESTWRMMNIDVIVAALLGLAVAVVLMYATTRRDIVRKSGKARPASYL